MRIFVLNPGSTSTKIAVYEDLKPLFTHNVMHDAQLIAQFPTIASQYDFRKKEILKCLDEHEVSLESIDVFIGRGGVVKPIRSGVYRVNDTLLHDLHESVLGEHASNLGGIIAFELAQKNKKPSYIADPVVVNEMQPLAKISGLPGIERQSIFHALNQKAMARRYAREVGRPYESLRLIVAHLGGGTSVGSHENGAVIDVNNGLMGEGPFTPERAGAVPGGQLLELLVNQYQCDLKAMKKRLTGNGGVVAYLETTDMKKLSELAEQGDEKVSFILEAMAYQIAKSIGEAATVLKGEVDAIILTGGVAYSKYVTDHIEKRVKFIAPVVKMPGENEMAALAENAYFASRGEYPVYEYQ